MSVDLLGKRSHGSGDMYVPFANCEGSYSYGRLQYSAPEASHQRS